MTQWFSLHHFPLAKLRSFALAKLGRPCELIKAAATRFGTNTLVGERLLKLKGALQATCTDEEYVAMKYADKRATRRRRRALGASSAPTREPRRVDYVSTTPLLGSGHE